MVSNIVKTEINNLGLMMGNWQLGVVKSVISPKKLSVLINGSTEAQEVPCNPDVPFSEGDNVFVIFVNGDPRNKFVMNRRALITEETRQGSKANGALSLFPVNSKQDVAPYNFTVITGVRGGVPYTEVWILINAWYDYKTKRFKRVDVNNFSFGWQMQGGGTYPGEENFGDFINQGMNLWKANGKAAYGIGDPMRDATGEDIGAMINGKWQEFGIMLGWQNAFMIDSYAGMTIGGQGFEIDGNGTYPYKRVSLGKFNGGSITPNKPYSDYGYAYNGTLWNAFHGLFDSDARASNSFYWGMVSPIDFYDIGTYNPYSNRASLDNTKFVWRMLPKNKEAKIEHWVDVLSIDEKGNGNLLNRTISATLTIKADIVNGTDFNMSYPDSTWNKNNTYIAGVLGVLSDGTIKQYGNVNATFTDYGAYGYLGSGFVSAKILISKY